MKKIGLVLSAVTLMVSHGISQIINIPADQPSIQSGIDSASNGDTVLVAEGTYFENISFKGKEITVASQFLLDGDTSWISKTVINGSAPEHSDTGSVVRMVSGETVNSILQGFTITGGKGTFMQAFFINNVVLFRMGGGILIYRSGGTILNNVIIDNRITGVDRPFGGGMVAWIEEDNTIVIRDNKITANKIDALALSNGGGLLLRGGAIYLERNEISFNEADSEGQSRGGGIAWLTGSNSTNKILQISDNIISNNSSASTSDANAGGIYFLNLNEGYEIRVFNNLICDNFSRNEGGGIYFDGPAVCYNNTICNNRALGISNSLAFSEGVTRIILFNNIIWGFDNEISEFSFREGSYMEPDRDSTIIAINNQIRELFGAKTHPLSGGNIHSEPIFDTTTNYVPDGSNPGIGRGLDSVKVDTVWYYAPKTDFFGKLRPDPSGSNPDLGAIESPYEGYVYIPDTAFLYALIEEGVDTNGDSLISYAEAEEVIELDVDNRGISDMTGVEAFINMKKLWCYNNQLTSLDVSNNLALGILSCSENQITNLDVTINTSLYWLYCNNNQLTSLDVTNNTALIALGCSNNQLTSLDVTNNTALKALGCSNNQLINLDVSNNPAIGGYCGRGCSGGLDLSYMPSLQEVCVWTTPFPLDTVSFDTTGSPNVCFQTDCNGDCSIVGVAESCPQEVAIYPNPTGDLLNIETVTSYNYTINITSLNGQLIFSKDMEDPTLQLDLSSFPKGIYFIIIRSKDFVSTRKYIKL